MKPFFSGILGGAVIITIVALFFIFSSNLFIYNVQIINPINVDSVHKYVNKIELIKEMQKDGILLTPQEYTSNIVSYYNTAITLLVFFFILFSFIGYFHLKFVSKEQIQVIFEEKIKDSKEMEKVIMNAFAGKADDKYETIENVDDLRERMDTCEKTLASKFDEDDEQDDETIIASEAIIK
jgi:hypothetical protein